MTNKQLKQGLIKMIDKKLSEDPFVMRKTLQESYSKSGFLSYTHVPAVYDTKKAYSLAQTIELSKDGYSTAEDLGSFLFHAIINYE